MATALLFNRVRVSTATTGTGTITLGAKVSNKYATFAEGGVANTNVVTYTIEDGDNWEIGRGTYTSAGTTLSRDTVLISSVAGAVGTSKLNLSGSATVFITAAKEDLDVNDFTEDTAPDVAADFAWVHDASAALKKKVKLSRFSGLPPGFVSVRVQNNVTDAANDIDFLAGKCRDSTDAFDIALAATLTKQLDAAWAVGSGNGGLDNSTEAASLIYYLWIIKRSDTGVVDALFSLAKGDPATTFTVTIASPGVVTVSAGHGLQIGSPFTPSTTGTLPTGMTAGTVHYVIATGFTATTFQFSATQGGAAINTTGSQSGTHTFVSNPLMPTSYDQKQRVGWVRNSAASAILPFKQSAFDFDDIRYLTGILDVNVTNQGTTRTARPLSLPPNSQAFIRYHVEAPTSGNVLISPTQEVDAAPSTTAVPLCLFGAGLGGRGELAIPVDVSAQIQSDASANSDNIVRVLTLGCRFKAGIIP